VTVRTSGGDLDFDGYEVVVDPARRLVEANGNAEFRYIGVGTHSVALQGVADNCSVVGASSRSVAVERDKAIVVGFDVECAATGIAITTQASGVAIPDSVDVLFDGELSGPVPANGVTVASRLPPGRYAIAIASRGTNCSVVGDSEVVVDVVARTVTPVLFALTCAAPARSEEIAFAVDTTNCTAVATICFENAARAQWNNAHRERKARSHPRL
jgi:hypothetical protein